jgi:hypothetical protein
MLMDMWLREMDSEPDKDKFPTPVVGPISSSTPTSGDVHLYPDPLSFHTQFPKLFADSEGLNGGEKVPLGDRSNIHPALLSDGSRKGRKFWDLQWANDPQTRRREYAVRHMYPRFLYTFSDVVVYVLRNERQVVRIFAQSNLLIWIEHSKLLL